MFHNYIRIGSDHNTPVKIDCCTSAQRSDVKNGNTTRNGRVPGEDNRRSIGKSSIKICRCTRLPAVNNSNVLSYSNQYTLHVVSGGIPRGGNDGTEDNFIKIH